MRVTNYLLGYENLKIIQDNEMFNFSLDSVLLPNFITINESTKNILDIGKKKKKIPAPNVSGDFFVLQTSDRF